MNLLKKSKPYLSSLLNSHRSYYSNPRPVLHHFPRGGGSSTRRRWYHNPRSAAAAAIITTGGAATIYFSNLEPVPYTKRSHLVLVPLSVERQLGESQFNELKSSLRSKILPPLHPDSVRVRLISADIISALHRGLLRSQTPKPLTLDDQDDVISSEWSPKDEVLDDRWVTERKPGIKHLDGLNWEVVVIRDPMMNAFCLPGGKIVVFTGLLDHFKMDAEIAIIIGHEVGHAVARHAAEGITKNLWLALLQLIALQFFYMPDLINAMSLLLLRLPFSRRMEIEADYIGVLLAASAGYDPRVAPRVYEKLGQITGDSALRDYMSTHPSSKKRSQLLSQAKVMDEALAIYRESTAGRDVAGFL